MLKWTKHKNIIDVAAIGVVVVMIAAAVVVASRNRQQPLPPPEVPVAQRPAVVRVKAVERKAVAVESSDVEAAKPALRRTSMEFGILLPETA